MKGLVVLFALSLLFSTAAWAQRWSASRGSSSESKNEIYVSTLSGSATDSAIVTLANNSGTANIEGGYNYSLTSYLAVGTQTVIGYGWLNDGTHFWLLEPLVGPTLNIPFGGSGAMARSLFFFAQAGIQYSEYYSGFIGASVSNSNFAFSGGLGVRVPIVSHVAWRPEVAWMNVQNNGSSFEIIPFAIAALF